MQRVGPFYDEKEDLYETDRGLHWFLWLLVIFYTIGLLLYVAVVINNISRPHTYFKNPGTPGQLFSLRYDIYWVVEFLSVIVVFLFPLCVMLMIIYRNVYGCNIGWTIVFFILFGLHLFTVVTLIGAYAECNQDEQFANPCNDYKWCCVPAVYSVLANMCPNSIPCAAPGSPTTRAELRANADFLWLFWMNVFFFILHVLYLAVVFLYWGKTINEPQKTIEDPQQYEDFEKTESRSVGSMVRKPHGLVNRNKKRNE